MTADEYRRTAAADMSEAVLQQRVQELATMLGWWWWHAPDNRPIRTKTGRTYVQNVRAGWPDLVLLRGPHMLLAELKTQSGRLSPDQREVHTRLAATGHAVHVWRPLDLLDGTIAAVLTNGDHL